MCLKVLNDHVLEFEIHECYDLRTVLCFEWRPSNCRSVISFFYYLDQRLPVVHTTWPTKMKSRFTIQSDVAQNSSQHISKVLHIFRYTLLITCTNKVEFNVRREVFFKPSFINSVAKLRVIIRGRL